MKRIKYIFKNLLSIKGNYNSIPIRLILQKKHITVKGCNNIIEIDKSVKFLCDLKIVGNNNKIRIANNSILKGKINIFGNYNSIECGQNSNVTIETSMGFNKNYQTNNTKLVIGNNVGIVKATMQILDKNSYINIGDETIMSYDITFWASDTHSILSNNGKLLNKGKNISIGKKCWIGYNCHFVKNTKILDGSIIGLGSIVTKSFNKKNVLIAGNPARIIKENIIWNKLSPNEYEGVYNESK